MNLAGLLATLQSAGQPIGWEDVGDALWLAAVVAGDRSGPTPPLPAPATAPVTAPEPVQLPTALRAGPAADGELSSRLPPAHPRAQVPAAPTPDDIGVYLPTASPAGSGGRPVRIAVAPLVLGDAHHITRQLRPLKRRAAVRGRPVLDEDATVERIAETRLWQPVFTAPLGRWLDLDVVVDDGPSMAIWDRPTAALVDLLARLGAFHRITTWRLDTTGSRAVLRNTGRNSAPHDPRELIDPTGRRAVLLLSDGIGTGWRSGTVDRALAGWATAGPVAIWHSLAPRLWRRTAMRVQWGVVGASRPGQPTSDYVVRLDDGQVVRRPRFGVPVLSSGQGSLGGWARLLAIGGLAVSTLRVVDDSAGTTAAARVPVGVPSETDPHAVITRFRTESSATAMRLAIYLSAVPLTVETMRVAQTVMLPESGSSHLTEVFLGGLLRRLPVQGTGSAPAYDFVEGVREALLAAITRAEAREVLDRVADASALPLAERRGLRAVLDDPLGSGGAALDAMDRPFARVARTVLHRLGGPHADLVLKPSSAPRPEQLAPVGKARIVERTDHQLLSFDWPVGADAVLAYIGAPGKDAQHTARREPAEEISHGRYVAEGALYLHARLPARGCSVHLVPVANDAGRRIEGPAVTLAYPCLLRLRYSVRADRDRQRHVSALAVQIVAEFDVGTSPYFTLVHRPDRLPLHDRDGSSLAMTPVKDLRGRGGLRFRPSVLPADPGDAAWTTQVDDLTGYVRLFVVLPSENAWPVALIDPPIDQLRLVTSSTPRRTSAATVRSTSLTLPQ